jgi:NADP-dependent 3-hydroxy acid dehydrogenase YdfG
MRPRPQARSPHVTGAKLAGKVALITGGDSGIGRAVAVAFAQHGADVVILYRNEHRDARESVRLVEREGRRCLAIAGDIGREAFCRRAVRRAVGIFRRLDILVNNAAEQHPRDRVTAITGRQLERTFRTNVFGMFFMTKAAFRHLRPGSAIINTTSVTAYRGSHHLIDYAATKGAIVAFTRSLAQAMADRKVRERSCAGPDLDTAHPGVLSGSQGGHIRLRRAHGAGWGARRDRPELRVPGLGRCVLHDRAGAPPQRWRDRQRLRLVELCLSRRLPVRNFSARKQRRSIR